MTQLEKDVLAMGLAVGTSSPGDGVTRYRFFNPKSSSIRDRGDSTVDSPNASYNCGDGLYTALGRKEAIAFLAGYNIRGGQ